MLFWKLEYLRIALWAVNLGHKHLRGSFCRAGPLRHILDLYCVFWVSHNVRLHLSGTLHRNSVRHSALTPGLVFVFQKYVSEGSEVRDCANECKERSKTRSFLPIVYGRAGVCVCVRFTLAHGGKTYPFVRLQASKTKRRTSGGARDSFVDSIPSSGKNQALNINFNGGGSCVIILIAFGAFVYTDLTKIYVNSKIKTRITHKNSLFCCSEKPCPGKWSQINLESIYF